MIPIRLGTVAILKLTSMGLLSGNGWLGFLNHASARSSR